RVGLFLLALALLAAPAFAQAPAKKETPLPADHPHPPVEKARTFEEGWLRIHDALRDLEFAIEDGAALDASSSANSVMALGARLGGILMQPDCPYPKEKA